MTHSNHGIVRDERGEEQPRDKQRAQTVHKWQSLKYDTNLGGYVTGITANELRNAPHYGEAAEWNWSDDTKVRALNAYYGVPIV